MPAGTIVTLADLLSHNSLKPIITLHMFPTTFCSGSIRPSDGLDVWSLDCAVVNNFHKKDTSISTEQVFVQCVNSLFSITIIVYQIQVKCRYNYATSRSFTFWVIQIPENHCSTTHILWCRQTLVWEDVVADGIHRLWKEMCSYVGKTDISDALHDCWLILF